MTNPIPDYSSFEKYMYGALAARLGSSEESSRYAPNALELLAGSKGLNLGEEAEGFIKGTRASEEGIKTAIGIYAGKFNEKREEYKPSDLVAWYSPLLADLDSGDKDKITGILGKHNESLKSINKKFKIALKIVKDSKDKDLKELYTTERISEAEETLKKYEKIMQTLNVLDNYKFEGLRPDAVNEARKEDLKGLAPKL